MLENLTPQAWEQARGVLFGEAGDKEKGYKVSYTAAAKAAGVTRKELMAWIRRAKKRMVEDEPWIHSIADDVEQIESHRADELLDVVWDKAMAGDAKLALTLLKKYDPEYREQPEFIPIMDMSEMFRRIQALQKIEQAKLESPPIDGQFEHVEEDVFAGLPETI